MLLVLKACLALADVVTGLVLFISTVVTPDEIKRKGEGLRGFYLWIAMLLLANALVHLNLIAL